MFRITTLCENSVDISRGIVGEHGLSFYIEHEDGIVLFDTGQGIGISRNAQALGKDLGAVGTIVLSHGHYDHTGGLSQVLDRAGGVPTVVAHPDVFQEKMAVLAGMQPVPIGITVDRVWVQERADLRLVREPWKVGRHATTTGEVPMVTGFETIDPGLHVMTPEGLVRDEVLDDLSLILDTSSGTVIVAGCSHRGIVNIVRRAMEITGSSRVHAVLGGFHLQRAGSGQMEGTIEAFEEFGLDLVVVSHCTGLEASSAIRNSLGGKVAFNRVGAVFEF